MLRQFARPKATLLCLVLVACEASTKVSPGPAYAPPIADLPPYEGPMRVLFDDAIDPEVFASDLDAVQGTTDRRLVERIRSAAFVVPVTVVTVTEEKGTSSGLLELELVPTDPPIHGSLSAYIRPGDPIRVKLSSGSAAFALGRSAQSELVGKRMNLCWARFSDGSSVVEHWHALSDSPRTKQAISRAVAIVNLE